MAYPLVPSDRVRVSESREIALPSGDCVAPGCQSFGRRGRKPSESSTATAGDVYLLLESSADPACLLI